MPTLHKLPRSGPAYQIPTAQPKDVKTAVTAFAIRNCPEICDKCKPWKIDLCLKLGCINQE